MQPTHSTPRRHTKRFALLAGILLAGCAAATVPVEGALADPYTGEGFKMAFTFTMPKPLRRTDIFIYKYRTVDGTARAGEDYVAMEGMVVFRHGRDRQTLLVQTLRDGDDEEGDETFSVRIYDGKMMRGRGMVPLPGGYPKEMKVTGVIKSAPSRPPAYGGPPAGG